MALYGLSIALLLVLAPALGGCLTLPRLIRPTSLPTNVPHEQVLAGDIAKSWGLGLNRRAFELAGESVSPQSVIQGQIVTDAFVVGIRNKIIPQRRNASAGEAFLAVVGGNETENAALSRALAVTSINLGANLVESVLGRSLFPFRLEATEFADGSGHTPFAVYDVSHGHVYLNRRQLQGVLHAPEHVIEVVESFSTAIFEELAGYVTSADAGGHSIGKLAGVMTKFGVLASVVAFAATVPIWFCIACPAVLGLLAPFLFNLGLGEGAELLCQHYQLPDDACNELWISAFALALILSLASTIPIVYICRLPECGKQA